MANCDGLNAARATVRRWRLTLVRIALYAVLAGAPGVGCSVGDTTTGDTEAAADDLFAHRGRHHIPWWHWHRPRTDRVRICHFPPGSRDGRIIEIPERALEAHLAHGDGLAPTSVRSDSNCAVPQPPPEPVSVTATTGTDGTARFVIPETNIRVVATVTDAAGASLAGVAITFLTSSADYLLLAQELGASPRYAPAFSEGSLLSARPGSAPTVLANIAMTLFTSALPGVGILQPGGTIPRFIANHFTSTTDRCFSEGDFRGFLLQACVGGSIAGSSVSTFVFSLVGFPPSLLTPSLASVFQAFNATQCAQHAVNGAAAAFQGATTPFLLIREYRPPFLPGVPMPFLFEYLGPCGGACCGGTSSGACVDVRTSSACTTGGYHDAAFCSSDPCVCPPGTVRCGGTCVDLQTDANNCGGCGNACASTESCIGGQCVTDQADLAIVLANPQAPPTDKTEPGFSEHFEFHFENRGPANATPMVVRVAMSGPIYSIDASARVFPGSPAGPVVSCQDSGGDLLCDLTQLSVPAGSVVVIVGEVAASDPGAVRLRANAISFVADPRPLNNTGVVGWDFECRNGEQWNAMDRRCECPAGAPQCLLETLFVDGAQASPVSSNVTLEIGRRYLIQASGTYFYSGPVEADAAYANSFGWPDVRTDVGVRSSNPGVTSLLVDLGAGIRVVDWGDYSDAHVYRYEFAATSTSLRFVISDWWSDWYGSPWDNQLGMVDNSGGLSVELYAR